MDAEMLGGKGVSREVKDLMKVATCKSSAGKGETLAACHILQRPTLCALRKGSVRRRSRCVRIRGRRQGRRSIAHSQVRVALAGLHRGSGSAARSSLQFASLLFIFHNGPPPYKCAPSLSPAADSTSPLNILPRAARLRLPLASFTATAFISFFNSPRSLSFASSFSPQARPPRREGFSGAAHREQT